MKNRIYRSLLLIALFSVSFASPAKAQETLLLQYADGITAGELRHHVEVLASDSLEGRFTGSEGQRKAGAYIAGYFEKINLGNFEEDTYFQKFSLDRCIWLAGQVSRKQYLLDYPYDFIILDEPVEGRKSTEAIFGGFGLDEEEYSDLSNIDVSGKVIVAFAGEPQTRDGRYILSGTGESSQRSRYYMKFRKAMEKGATGMILIAASNKDFKKYQQRTLKNRGRSEVVYPGSSDTTEFFGIYTTVENAAPLINIPVRDLKSFLKDPVSGKAESLVGKTGNLTAKFRRDCTPLETENVFGFIRGTSGNDEWVVVVAHYDHLGKADRDIFYGADDNASGTAAVMELAEAFTDAARDGIYPGRNILFLLVSAEELGLYGSRYFTENCPMPLEKIHSVVNIDMIGRRGDRFSSDDYIYGWGYLSREIVDIAGKNAGLLAPGLEFRMTYSEKRGGGSDHYYFVRNGIPALFYFSGIHNDYHEPGDTADKLLYGRMEKAVRSIFGTVMELANMPGALEIEEN